MKKEIWFNYSVAAGASFAYFLMLPSLGSAKLDRILLLVASNLFGISLILNTMFTMALRKSNQFSTLAHKNLSTRMYKAIFIAPLLLFAVAVVLFFASISASLALISSSSAFIFLSLYKYLEIKNKSEIDLFYKTNDEVVLKVLIFISVALVVTGFIYML
ncbi:MULTISPECIES: hypothetical protein [Pseudoalteromonas]|jgi:hypothetical protein|uniref:hypothetical protein n=1 Tax=Pseudoalteromonas TaxID=53246 RepID=UPI000977530A|nr:hypothetical protein [Pseudoalteromonas sp. EB27]|tara:strand:- start:193 stop:672 length:480 start_codon:yes stop_codon:yes gene_type:complete